MGDIMAMIDHNIWQINIVGTTQINRAGANVIDRIGCMKKGMYKSVCEQHNMWPLCYAVWLDNNLVKTVSNFHGREILAVE